MDSSAKLINIESQTKHKDDNNNELKFKQRKQKNQKRNLDGRAKNEPLAKRLRKLATVSSEHEDVQNSVCLKFSM